MHLHKMQATNNRVNLIIILLPILLLVIPCTPTTRAADHLFIICPTTQNYTSNSSFESNLLLLLKSITSNTSLSGGFYNTSFGSTADDSVYGLALCRGDVTPEVCQNCVNNASRGIVEQCPSGKQATIFYEFCHIRYSEQNFFSMMVYAGKYPTWNNTKQDILDPDQYTPILNGLMTDISNRAAFDSSSNMFATGEANLMSTGRKLYGLGQCTRDISREECKSCLTGAVGDIVGCCSSDEGGIVVDNSCNLRYEMYSFYRVGVVPASPQLPPSTTPTTRKKMKGSRAAIITSVLVVVLVTLMGSWYCYQFRKKGKKRDHGESNSVSLHDFGGLNLLEVLPLRNTQTHDENHQMDNQELPLMDLSTIKLATDNFSDSNKLGHGGFGVVYKGRLSDGNEIAVKRLSRKSWQGLEEFKNEVTLIARLQHRNLVKLLSYGIEGEEKLLIYEFMPNKSLDLFIFDETKRSQLDWKTRSLI